MNPQVTEPNELTELTELDKNLILPIKDRPILIGVSGKKGSGKDTFANMLCRHYYLSTLNASGVAAFADPLKDVASTLFDWSSLGKNRYGQNHLDADKDQILEPWGVSWRHILQKLGTEIFRDQMEKVIPGIGPNLWLHLAARKVRANYFENVKLIVFSDLRFENEANWIKANGGYIIHISRPTLQSQDTHSSESFDWVSGKAEENVKNIIHIQNNGGLQDLEIQASAFLQAHSLI